MNTFSRRGFLAATSGLAAMAALPRLGSAAASPLSLYATTRVIDVNGRAATVLSVVDGAGKSGLVLDPGQRFRLTLTNKLTQPTLIHWHGQIPPNRQDGVPDMPMPKLQPGETRDYDFAPEPGTHWMHSHVPMQEFQLLAAPLIVRTAADAKDDRQEVAMFLHDFSFNSPEEIMAAITGGNAGEAAASASPSGAMAGMAGAQDMGAMQGMAGMTMGDMAGMAMDLNDYDFDAYLTNDRTLSDPEIVSVEKSGRVRLRVINGASATVFWIETGEVEGRLVAVDGHAVQPVTGRRFGVAMAQRLDIELDLPKGGGAWPVLALREGTRERTGLILATSGAGVRKLADQGEEATGAFGLELEAQLRGVTPLPDRPATNAQTLMLSGAMQPYVWTINGQPWASHAPVTAKNGERVELTFHNMSMMSHPMHLHGHVFQVVAINGTRFAGARRDTVLVSPMARVTIALDAGEAARWVLHCHHMAHLATGMMTELAISA